MIVFWIRSVIYMGVCYDCVFQEYNALIGYYCILHEVPLVDSNGECENFEEVDADADWN